MDSLLAGILVELALSLSLNELHVWSCCLTGVLRLSLNYGDLTFMPRMCMSFLLTT